jgi:argininosuccinate lyase
MKAAAGEGYSTATDLADFLVQKLAIPFREAHEIVGKVVTFAAESGRPLHRLTPAELQAIDKRIPEEALASLSVARSVASRTSYGGTAPKNVRAAARKWLKRLGK